MLVVVAAILLAAAVALSVAVGVMGAPLPGDRRVLLAVQDIDALDPLAPPVNWLGGIQWHVLIVTAAATVALAARYPRCRAGAPWTLVLLGSCMLCLELDQLLKVALRSPRPVADGSIEVTELQTTYGFPSGHVYGDVLVAGALTAAALRFLPPLAAWPVAGASAVFIVLAGLSRLVTGAHWPVDVLGGLLWGLAVLLLAVAAAGAAGRRLRRDGA